MAFAKRIEEFGSDIPFHVGQRVRAIIYGINQNEVASNTGIITSINVKFVHTPSMRQIRIGLRMDAEYFKKTMLKGVGEFLTLDISEIRSMEENKQEESKTENFVEGYQGKSINTSPPQSGSGVF